MSDAPPVGKIRLHDAVVPELTAGRYRVTSTLKISAGGADLVAPPAQLMHVQIDAARFAIDAGGVVTDAKGAALDFSRGRTLSGNHAAIVGACSARVHAAVLAALEAGEA